MKNVIEHAKDDEISKKLRDYMRALPHNDPEQNEKVFVLRDAHEKSQAHDTASESASSSTADLSKTSSSEK